MASRACREALTRRSGKAPCAQVQRIFVQILKKGSLSALMGGALFLTSCSSGSSSGGSSSGSGSDQIIALSEGEGQLALERKYTMQKGDVEYTEEGGVTGGRRSQYEGKKQVQFGGDWNNESYAKKEYEKKSWWGGKKVEKKSYSDGADGSRFQTASAYGSKDANQAGQRSNYDGAKARTATYRTDAANESGLAGVSKPSNPQSDFRRGVYPKPRIVGYKDYQEKTIEQTRSLLGRDD